MRLNLWDLSGDPKVNLWVYYAWILSMMFQTRALWRHHYVCSDAVFFVVDSTDHARMGNHIRCCSNESTDANCTDEAVECLYQTLEDAQDELESAPLVLLCNKQDLDGAMPAPLIAEKFDLENRVFDRYFYCQVRSHFTSPQLTILLF